MASLLESYLVGSMIASVLLRLLQLWLFCWCWLFLWLFIWGLSSVTSVFLNGLFVDWLFVDWLLMRARRGWDLLLLMGWEYGSDSEGGCCLCPEFGLR